MTFILYHLLCLLKALEDSDPDVWNKRHKRVVPKHSISFAMR